MLWRTAETCGARLERFRLVVAVNDDRLRKISVVGRRLNQVFVWSSVVNVVLNSPSSISFQVGG